MCLRLPFMQWLMRLACFMTVKSPWVGISLKRLQQKLIPKIHNLPIDADDIRYPAEYQHYQTQSVAKPRSELITQSLEDAAKVLAYKVLDTLETDPDPWLLMSLSSSQETP